LKNLICFRTDYFILQYTPFNDFHGEFVIDPLGVHSFEASWGTSFTLTADLSFKDQPYFLDSTIRINSFELERIHDIASKPLPKKLAGTTQGKIKISGDYSKPMIEGNISIDEGTLGKLDYDRAFIHFNGFPPYLTLSDSKIMKGRTKLAVTGAIDFRLDNILHGIRVSAGDKLILLSGIELNTSSEKGDVEIKRSSWPKRGERRRGRGLRQDLENICFEKMEEAKGDLWKDLFLI